MVLDRSFDYNFHLNLPTKLLCSEELKPIIIKGFVPQPLTEWSNNLKNDLFSVIKESRAQSFTSFNADLHQHINGGF